MTNGHNKIEECGSCKRRGRAMIEIIRIAVMVHTPHNSYHKLRLCEDCLNSFGKVLTRYGVEE